MERICACNDCLPLIVTALSADDIKDNAEKEENIKF